MRERINRLARGIIDSGIPELVLAPDKVEAAVPAGEVIRGEIVVSSGNNLHIKGLVYSSHARVQVVDNAFGGLRNRIIYEVNSRIRSMGTSLRDLFILSPMEVRGRFLILCAYRPETGGKYSATLPRQGILQPWQKGIWRQP